MAVIAKFRVSSITDFGGTSRQITMNPVYVPTEDQSGANPEDVRFTKATPSGELKMMVDNPGAYDQFSVGDAWYLRMEKVEPVTA
jgi:hypothetical protein